MSLLVRSAIVQARKYPAVKLAGEDVLRRMGLTMTEAVELFLRRVIVDQKIPFEIVAFDDATLSAVVEKWEVSIAAHPSKVGNHRKTSRHRVQIVV